MTRRDNGLPGDEWQLLADLAPGLADEALDALRDAGIAAYATPAADDQLDQVFVGRDEVLRARDVVERALPHAEHRDVAERGQDVPAKVTTDDDVWAGIVAAYSAPAADPVGRWSAVEDADPHEHAESGTAATAGATTAGAPELTSADDTGPNSPRRDATGFEDIEAEVAAARPDPDQVGPPADDPHDHYVPPEPPPIPRGDPVTRAAWVGVLGGPLFLILATLLGWGPGGFTGLIAVLAFVGGFITLITRMSDERDDDEDDGAVV